MHVKVMKKKYTMTHVLQKKKKKWLEYKIYGDARVQFHIGCLTTNVSDMGRMK